MKRPAVGMLFALALCAGAGCGKRRDQKPAPAAKPISPPAVEPLPAPRARGQLPSPAGSPVERTPRRTDAGPGPARK